MDTQASVMERYSAAAESSEAELCCPVNYDIALLKMIPAEIIDRDYGCGDPSRYVREGDTVVDLGSGSGKICYMAAQLVGDNGLVIGVDMNDDMLALARSHQATIADQLGGDRLRFVKGYIQDLALDLDAVAQRLADHPVSTLPDQQAFTAWQTEQRQQQPLIADNSVDLVISNCVLNLVDDGQKHQLMAEIFRVLKPGGRIAISDIIADEAIPAELKQDEQLWSGCISGAFEEREFLQAALNAGFIGARLDKWESAPWQTVAGIEFRSATLTAIKGAGTDCMDYGHAVIYKGPYSEIYDDEEHVYPRGARVAVCERTYSLLTENPAYNNDFIGIPPAVMGEPQTWCAPAGTLRSPAQNKGAIHLGDGAGCDPATGCC